MLNNYFTLAALVNEIRQDIESSRIIACLTHVESTLEIVIEKQRSDRKTLAVSCRPRMNYLFLDAFPKKRLLGANVLPEAIGTTIDSIYVEDNERTVALKLSNGLSLIMNLFGPHANVYLVDKDGSAVAAFLKGKKGLKKGFGISPVNLGFPESAWEFVSRFRALTTDAQQGDIRDESQHRTAERTLSRVIPTFTGGLAKEALYRSVGEGGVIIPGGGESSLDDNQLATLFSRICELRVELAEPHSRIYFSSEPRPTGSLSETLAQGTVPMAMSLIEMRHLGSYDAVMYESVNACIGAFVIDSEKYTSQVDLKRNVLDRLTKRKEDLQNTIMKIDDDMSVNREEKYRRCGDILMQHLSEIEKGSSAFRGKDSEGCVTDILLNPRLTPVRNAQLYYERAKKARESYRLAIARREKLKKESDKVEVELRRIEAGVDRKDLASIDKMERSKSEAQTPFRQFEAGGYKIYVGKDARNNDQLTFGFAKPNDVFLHARGVSGSHVIIRNSSREYPQKQVIKLAASIAAHYSKARTSGIVPVAYTMRKFMKKVKGQPGAVLLDREEVVFVKPGIPSAGIRQDESSPGSAGQDSR